MINTTQHKFKVGDFIKPIKGKIVSCDYNIKDVVKCKVVYLSKNNHTQIQIKTILGYVHRNGYDRTTLITIVNPNDFELYNSIDDYEIF